MLPLTPEAQPAFRELQSITVACLHPGSGFNSYPLDRMAANLAEDIFKCIIWDENDRIPIPISLKFVPRTPIGKMPASVQVMAWGRTGDKPLPELMLTQFTDAYKWH